LLVGDRVVVDGQYRLTPGAQVVEMQTGGNQEGRDAKANGNSGGGKESAQ
jgi:hypothetical protein